VCAGPLLTRLLTNPVPDSNPPGVGGQQDLPGGGHQRLPVHGRLATHGGGRRCPTPRRSLSSTGTSGTGQPSLPARSGTSAPSSCRARIRRSVALAAGSASCNRERAPAGRPAFADTDRVGHSPWRNLMRRDHRAAWMATTTRSAARTIADRDAQSLDSSEGEPSRSP
jgi:hypothetical protein